MNESPFPPKCCLSRCSAVKSRFALSGKKRVMLWRERKQSSSFPNPRRPGSPDGPADLEELLKPKRTSKESDALGEGQCQHSDPQEATGSRKRKMGDFQRKFALSSVQFSCSVLSDSLRPHESQHTRLPCSSPTVWA